MKKILVYDDEERFKKTLEESLSSLSILEREFEVASMSEQDFGEALDSLKTRQIGLRDRGSWTDGDNPLDDVAIFVVDYDLVLNEEDPFLTGETVAYLVRCFSRCGLIVAVNQYRHDFDLTLRGHPESFADLNVTDSQLGNPNLWGETAEGFHPWYWPVLPSYQQDLEKKIRDVGENLDEPICKVLGFDCKLFDVLPRSVSEFLSTKKRPSEITFRDFVLGSGNGLRAKDALEANDDVLARVGAARVAKWLERLVLPEQDILVDAPHLVSRYPSLLAGDPADIETWNATARKAECDLGMNAGIIEAYRLKQSHWVSRPVWFWEGVRECKDILEVREPWKIDRPDWVFCEDASRFHEEEYREFVAATESPYSRRFVRYFDGIKYSPIVRLSM